jgi:putative transposase
MAFHRPRELMMRYVEDNPVRTRLVKRPEQYRWLSVRVHLRGGADAILSEDCYLVKEHGDWSAYVREKDDAQLIKEVRQSTKTGRPCGDEGFLRKLEGMLGRKLAALPRSTA